MFSSISSCAYRMMIPALVFLILVICTNYSMMFFICHGLHIYGAWLHKYKNAELWLLRVLVSLTKLSVCAIMWHRWGWSSREVDVYVVIILFFFPGTKWCDDLHNMDDHCDPHQPDHRLDLWREDVPDRCCHHLLLGSCCCFDSVVRENIP